MFVENVLSEVTGKASLVAMDCTGSITLQRLLPLSSPDQVAKVMAELGGESGSDFKAISCDRCGGHVVESAIRQVSRLTGMLNGFTSEWLASYFFYLRLGFFVSFFFFLSHRIAQI